MNRRRAFIRGLLLAAAILGLLFAMAGCSGEGGGDAGEDAGFSPIRSVLALGFVDKDGAKVKGLALEYEQDMTGAAITADTYRLKLYDSQDNRNFGGGEIGQITNWYIHDQPQLSDGAAQGSGSGNYVILEVYTDYLSSSESVFTSSMLAHVTQTADIALPDGTVIQAGTAESNNAIITKTVSEITGNVTTTTRLDPQGFSIPELEGFAFYIDEDPNGYGKAGDGFHWEHCFDQQDGLYYDVSVAYALWKPADWHEGGNYAMVTLENPAADPGTHPLLSVLQTRSPVYYATTGQEVVKAAHPELDGMIVVVPVVTQRVNDNGGTPAEYEAIVHLWDYLIDTCSVNPDYIYGSGQSVGGMILIETQRNRDNFFAGLLLYEDQWAQNYYIDTLFVRNMAANEKTAATAAMHYPRTDEQITWNCYFDSDGEPVSEDHDPYNLYYLVSDDNILVLRSGFNGLCTDNWNEMSFLYQDLTGDVHNGINQQDFDLSDGTTRALLEEENAAIAQFLSGESAGTRNINAVTFQSGGNGYSIRMYDATYEWLLAQSRESETAREKLDINKPFVPAAEQLRTGERKLHFTDTEGNDLYFITGEAGAGTRFYNTGWYNLLTVADAAPGWLPEGMGDWTEGAQVEGANILSVQVIENGTAVAVLYDRDMSQLTVRLVGDEIPGLDGAIRQDIQIEVPPFAFFDGEGNEIDCTIQNVYVNELPQTVSGAARGSGTGSYVIVELTAPIAPAAVIQRTTLHTDRYIASALPWKYEVNE